MGRPSLTRQLAVWMNGERVGEWRLPGRGPQEFVNDPASLISPQFRPLSLSLSVGLGAPVLRGEVLQHWFANLLPDNNAIRVQRKQRFSLQGISAFELLMAAGPDYAGAVQLPPPPEEQPTSLDCIEATPLSDTPIGRLLLGVVAGGGPPAGRRGRRRARPAPLDRRSPGENGPALASVLHAREHEGLAVQAPSGSVRAREVRQDACSLN